MRLFLGLLGCVLAVSSVKGDETGAQCYARACATQVGLRNCFTCCNTNCTQMADCQCKCDKSCLTINDKVKVEGPDISAFIKKVDRTDDDQMFALLTTPRFDAPTFTREAMQIADWATVAGSEVIGKLAVATISERFVVADMDSETRVAAQTALIDAMSDDRLGVRWVGLICLVESGLIHTPSGLAILVERALTEPDPQLAEKARTTLESLR